MTKRLTAADLLDRLRVKFGPPAFAFLPAVRSNTGFTGAERYADAVAMSLWPSRGLELHGFEVKVSRGDWLRELKQPEKAEAICQLRRMRQTAKTVVAELDTLLGENGQP